MADHNSLAHVFVSGIAEGSNSALVGPNEWNKEHRFAGGTAGQRLFWDTTQTDFVRWAGAGFIDVTAPPYNVPNDGVTDAAASITSMLTAIGSNGAYLFFPPGIYLTTSATNPLMTLSTSNITLVGARGRTIFRQAGAADILTITSPTDIIISGVQFDGASAAARGVHATSVQNLVLDNCAFSGLRSFGVHIDGAGSNKTTLSNLDLLSSATMSGTPAMIKCDTNTQGISIRDCYFNATNYPMAIDARGSNGVAVFGCTYLGNFTSGCNVLNGPFAEFGTWYDNTSAINWDWQADTKLTLVGIRSTFTTAKINNYATRNLGLLTLMANADMTSTVGLLGSIAGSSLGSTALFQTCGLVSSQFSTGGIGNGADTTDDTLFSYTLPANAFDNGARNRVLRIRVVASTANNGNNKRFRFFFGGTLLFDTGTVTWAIVYVTFEIMVVQTSATAIMGSMQWVTSGGVAGATRFTGNPGITLSSTPVLLAFTGASPTTGAANDCLAYQFQAEWQN